MLTINKPNEAVIQRFLQQQSLLTLNYAEIGSTAGELPSGYNHHCVAVSLGEGDDVFQQAKQFLDRWQQFHVGWVEAFPQSTPLVTGQNIAIRAKFLGLWALAACRIVERIDDEDGPVRRYGFAMGTLPDHPEQGEERFEIKQSTDGRVTYSVRAFFRPNGALPKIAWPYLRYRFNRFREQSTQTMKRSGHCASHSG